MDKAAIVVTSAGTLVGQCIIDTLHGRRQNINLIAADSVGSAPHLFAFDAVHLVPETASGDSFLSAVDDLARKYSAELVVPGSDPDVSALARLKSRTEGPDRFCVGHSDPALAIEDKWRSYEFSRDNGIRFASTIRAESVESSTASALLEAGNGFVVAKPRRGSASRGVRLLRTPEEVVSFKSASDYVLQANVAGFGRLPDQSAVTMTGAPLFFDAEPERLWGCQTPIGPDGTIGPTATVSLHQRAGQLLAMTRLFREDLANLAETAAVAFRDNGWRGMINTQGGFDVNDEPVAFEFNGRFNGGTSSRLLMGYDEVGWTINSWLGASLVPELDVEPTRTVSRTFTQFAAPEAQIAELSAAGRWPAFPPST